VNDLREARRSVVSGDLESQVTELVSEALGRPIEDSQARLDELGLDSLGRLELLAAIEERFAVSLTEDLVKEFRSISRISRVVHDAIRLQRSS
jgi:acyl carrier protein